MTEKLYPPTQAILAARSFVKVEPHDEDDPESSDLLWIEYTPNDPLSEGEVLCISPLISDKNLWWAAMNSAYKFGGWPMNWAETGTSDEVIAGVLARHES